MTRLRFEVLGGRVGTGCTTRLQRPSLLRSIAVNLGLRAVNGPELIIDAGAAAGDASKAAGGQRLESTWRSIGGSEPGARSSGSGVRGSEFDVQSPTSVPPKALPIPRCKRVGAGMFDQKAARAPERRANGIQSTNTCQ